MRHSSFKNLAINEEIKKTLNEQLSIYQGIHYAYGIMNKKNPIDLTIITNKDAWFELYAKNKYQLTDPVLITALNHVLPFSWDENIMINYSMKLPKVFNIAKNYNIISGYTFMVHDPSNNLSILSLMTNAQDKSHSDFIFDAHKEHLQMLLLKVHDKLISLYNDTPVVADKDDISQVFSKRENEVLYYASLGKTYNEIATILDIKLPTVKFHTGNALKKMGVNNIRQGIKIANELHLITPLLFGME
ncbi:autoinducer binding domain-containing protein [Rouxiella sp. WC2420]|uniref:Autoinducer binding domain-containing protein n=1 Tax=Rouxiella sp. WC2420 TaxID=3234145 RepID=A0AB39VWM3_9GAMM